LFAHAAMVFACARQRPAAGKFWQRAVPAVAANCLPNSSNAPESAMRLMRSRSQFLAANKGVRAHSPAFVLLMHPRCDDDPAMGIGITVTKKVGNAVVRNRIKRRFRALSRAAMPEFGLPGADHVLIGKIAAKDQPFAEMQADFIRALGKAQAQVLRQKAESSAA
jgi:ribonuclease P protein component